MLRDRIRHCVLAMAGGALISASGIGQAATAQLDFGIIAPTPGTISFAGGATDALVGSNIAVDNVVGLGTPAHAGLMSACVACTLNFASGAFSGYDAGSKTWSFNGGGTISILGGIDFSDNTSIADIPTGTTLLSGVFTAASVTKLATNFFDFRIAAGGFTDAKDPTLLAYYGLPNGSYEGGLNLSFAGASTGGYGFASTAVYSGDIVNTPVPVPAAGWLLFSALAGLTGWQRSKKAGVGS